MNTISLSGSARSRRSVLLGTGATALAPILPRIVAAAATERGQQEVRLVAARGRVRLVPPPHPETAIWGYNGAVPGSEIRVRQGDRLRVLVENRLDEGTTVHWHGIRLPNAMDGAPHLTQPPIAPGERFAYEFEVPDAGTFWYHPHQRSFEQVGRGLYGALIVDEREPIRVDREVVWMPGDWRLRDDASINNDFGGRHDTSHAGRIGNTVTVNGRIRESFPVQAGERAARARRDRLRGRQPRRLDAPLPRLRPPGRRDDEHNPRGLIATL